ncbi:hypothetical protein ACH4Q6_15250 [Streptomyces lydicus]|uniref:hypothetical protein n=1 Tax=Streptomyces lydicus TaxID=47763 RepID=UPI0037ADD97B
MGLGQGKRKPPGTPEWDTPDTKEQEKGKLTPHSLAFSMDVVASGTVLGAKPTDSPDRVTAILGADFAENSFDEYSMWRDYGMVEFFWVRESRDDPWEGHRFTLQVHRLAHRGGNIVNGSMRDRYGRRERAGHHPALAGRSAPDSMPLPRSVPT